MIKRVLQIGVLAAIPLVALVCEGALVANLFRVEYALAAAVVIVIMAGRYAFRHLPRILAIAYMLAFLLFQAMALPNLHGMFLTPYIEMYRSDVRQRIAEAKERDGQFPQDIAPFLDLAARRIGRNARWVAFLKKRAHQYNPATGEFSVELF